MVQGCHEKTVNFGPRLVLIHVFENGIRKWCSGAKTRSGTRIQFWTLKLYALSLPSAPLDRLCTKFLNTYVHLKSLLITKDEMNQTNKQPWKQTQIKLVNLIRSARYISLCHQLCAFQVRIFSYHFLSLTLSLFPPRSCSRLRFPLFFGLDQDKN